MNLDKMLSSCSSMVAHVFAASKGLSRKHIRPHQDDVFFCGLKSYDSSGHSHFVDFEIEGFSHCEKGFA